MYIADELRRIAAKIEGFPRYIRRDCGPAGIRQSVKLMLEPYGQSDNEALVEAILSLTEELRQTTREYYEGQFNRAT